MNNFKTKHIAHQLSRIFPVLMFAFIFIFSRCNNHKPEPLNENEFYVCSMDPQVMEKQTGPCPICKMPLTKAVIDKSQMKNIKLNEEQMKLGNIIVDSVRFSRIGKEKTLSGIFTIDQTKTEQISARIGGRIEHLYHKIIGETVSANEPLYDLYSRDLLLAQEEYLLALEKFKILGNTALGLINASKNKLQLLGMTTPQIDELRDTKKTKITNTIYSKSNSTVLEIPLKEGDYVNEGTIIYKLAHLNYLWVEAQLYTNELELIPENNEVEVIPEALPGEQFTGKISFVNPELQDKSKINLIRIVCNNLSNLFKPGMQATIILKSEQHQAIVLPLDAVIQNGNNSVVWIENEKGSFEARSVETGIQNKNMIEIRNGLNEGERVVISGAYLVNSEYIFKRGTAPLAKMPGMKM